MFNTWLEEGLGWMRFVMMSHGPKSAGNQWQFRKIASSSEYHGVSLILFPRSQRRDVLQGMRIEPYLIRLIIYCLRTVWNVLSKMHYCDLKQYERLKQYLLQKWCAVMMILVKSSVLLVFTASSCLWWRRWLELWWWACCDQEVTSSYFSFIAACDTDVCADECSEVYVRHLEGRRITADTVEGGKDAYLEVWIASSWILCHF